MENYNEACMKAHLALAQAECILLSFPNDANAKERLEQALKHYQQLLENRKS